MRTTRDAITRDWLPCPDAREPVDLRLSFADCRKDHGCRDRSSEDCPLYVERLVKLATGGERVAPGARTPTSASSLLQSPII